MEIENFFSIYQQAAWNKDTPAMINLYAEKAVIFDMWNRGYFSNATEWNNMINDWLGSLSEEKVKVDFEMISINQSGNVGFASALVFFKAISTNGVAIRSMKNRITLCFSKFDDG